MVFGERKAVSPRGRRKNTVERKEGGDDDLTIITEAKVKDALDMFDPPI